VAVKYQDSNNTVLTILERKEIYDIMWYT